MGKQKKYKGFDEKTCQALGSYVYFLKDPKDDYPFYIGMGKNNRVFDHLNCAIKGEQKTAKLDKIREIEKRPKDNKVQHVILRHGLSDDEAFTVEAAMIDFSNFLGLASDEFKLTNIMGGHGSKQKGLMTAEEIVGLYHADPLGVMDKQSVLININKTYTRGIDPKGIYNATKECWLYEIGNLVDLTDEERKTVNEAKRDLKKKNGMLKMDDVVLTCKKNNHSFLKNYVLSEYNGLVVEVFEVHEWYLKVRGCKVSEGNLRGLKAGFGFNGDVAPDDVREKYISKKITKKQGDIHSVKFDYPVVSKKKREKE